MDDLSKFQLAVNADLFRRAASCVSSEPTRYYLNGVYATPCDAGGVLLISTDGHKMVAIRDPEGTIVGKGGIVSLEKAVLKECKEGRQILVSKKKATVVRGGKPEDGFDFGLCVDPNSTVLAFQWKDVLIDGTFPDWTRAASLPNFTVEKTGINPNFLLTVASSLGGKFSAVVAYETTPGGPIFVACPESHVDGFGLIMPVRCGAAKVPTWLAAIKKPAEVQSKAA